MSGINGTFGNTAASIILAEKLATDEKQMAKVGSLLSKFSLSLREITKTSPQVRSSLGDLLFNQYRTTAKTYPNSFNTYLLNVITMRYRIWMENQK